MDLIEDTGELTQCIIGCAMRVSNTLGTGFLEKVYENALAVELAREGLNFQQQFSLEVVYEGVVVGYFVCDILIEDRVILELKACRVIEEVHQAQLLNYLKATGVRVGLILNFGTPRLGIKRMVF